MKTRAAVLRDMGKDWEIIELELDPPKDGEVLIRFVAAGLCHSDDHLRTGDIPVRYPIVGGHEGAGIVEEVGAGVSRLKPGDHVVCSFLPTCGHCRFCAQGLTNLCDMGALFVAAGPPLERGLVVAPFENIHVYDLLCRILQINPAKNDGSPDATRGFFR